MWPNRRVAKLWIELLDMMPDNYFNLSQDGKRLAFLGIILGNANSSIRFNSMSFFPHFSNYYGEAF